VRVGRDSRLARVSRVSFAYSSRGSNVVYRVRAPNARIQSMHAERHNGTPENEAVEPRTSDIITHLDGRVLS
jgi:hypothetical protein